MARFWAKFKTWFIVGFAIPVTSDFMSDPPALDAAGIGYSIRSGMILGIGLGLIGGFTGGLAGGSADGFKTWFKSCFAVGFAFFLGIGLWLEPEPGLSAWLSDGLMFALMLGVVGGLAGGFLRGLRVERTTVANPRQTIRADMVYGLLIGPLAGLLGGLAGSLAGLVLAIQDGSELTDGLAAGPVIACAVGLVVGIASGCARAARRYGVFLLLSRGKLPFRLGVFLDWAVTAGLLRYSGPGYQFRHRELQQWLSQHPRP
ncbi:hypothetical protein ABT115_22980 [Streptomyces sp. NPDC001832]|uniref:hypothetical protein n=1 Tax=Streptomyces sp. NPDC001832 TaxID=3154527 RepID=UPI003317D8B4